MKKLFMSTVLAAVALPLTFAAQTPAPAGQSTNPPAKQSKKSKSHKAKKSTTGTPTTTTTPPAK